MLLATVKIKLSIAPETLTIIDFTKFCYSTMGKMKFFETSNVVK